MIQLSSVLEARLDAAWYKLQQMILDSYGGISQYDLDELCVICLEDKIEEIQKEKHYT